MFDGILGSKIIGLVRVTYIMKSNRDILCGGICKEFLWLEFSWDNHSHYIWITSLSTHSQTYKR